MFQHDLKPDLRIRCLDGTTPVDLTSVTAIKVVGVKGGAVIFSRGVADGVTGDADGWATMPWQALDTAEPGRIFVEVEVTWPGDKPQTFRPSGVVDVVADFG